MLEVYLQSGETMHPYYAWILMNKAYCLRSLGKPHEALEIFKMASSKLEQIRGKSNMDVADCTTMVGWCYTDLRQYKKARKEFREALEICSHYGREADYIFIEANEGLSLCYLREGENEKGLKHLLDHVHKGAEVFQGSKALKALITDAQSRLAAVNVEGSRELELLKQLEEEINTHSNK